MVDTRDKNVPKPSMLFFFIATTIYSVVKYNIDAKNLTLATTCYIITIIIGHYLPPAELPALRNYPIHKLQYASSFSESIIFMLERCFLGKLNQF